ncbi:MAG: hypothetical protein II836_03590, partial [Clostridia bacterium]|nr:hypothetical protein [Clostridia bacterium]
MKKSLQRLAALLLALLLLALTACSESGTNPETPAAPEGSAEANPAGSEEPSPEEPERLKPNIPETGDYGGDEIYFLVWELPDWASTVRQYRDIYAEGLTGEAINDAVYNRNALIESRYNVKITQERMNISNIDSAINKAVTSGDTTYDVVYPRLYEAAGMYQKNYFQNLMNVPHLDFDMPWWDSNCVASLSTNGILPAVATSINVNDKDATAAVAFSKPGAEDNGLEDLYTAVREGRWTFDLVASLSEQCNRDMNGDGTV